MDSKSRLLMLLFYAHTVMSYLYLTLMSHINTMMVRIDEIGIPNNTTITFDDSSSLHTTKMRHKLERRKVLMITLLIVYLIIRTIVHLSRNLISVNNK